MISRFDVGESEEGNDVVAECVGEFAKIDPRSFSYRYPVDTKGKPISLDQSQLDLAQLADVMKGIHGYFLGTDGYLDHLVGSAPTSY